MPKEIYVISIENNSIFVRKNWYILVWFRSRMEMWALSVCLIHYSRGDFGGMEWDGTVMVSQSICSVHVNNIEFIKRSMDPVVGHSEPNKRKQIIITPEYTSLWAWATPLTNVLFLKKFVFCALNCIFATRAQT